MVRLSDEEKNAVSAYLDSRESTGSLLGYYCALIGPTLAFFAYGLYRADVVAVGIAYWALLAVAVWYLRYSHRTTRHLIQALRKYESETGALRDRTSGG